MGVRGLAGRYWGWSLLFLAAFALLAAAAPPPASADSVVGTSGTGAGQVGNPRGLALDEADGLLFVGDAGNNRVDVFNAATGAFVRAFGWGVADGTTNALQVCTTTCFKGLAGSGSGQFDGIQGVAVDDNPASPGFHAVYVLDNNNHRVQRFTAAGAFVWTVGDGVNVTTSGDLCTAASGNVCGPGAAGDGAGQLNTIQSGGVAVGPGGTVYVADRTGSGATAKSRVQKYEASGAPAGQLLLEVTNGSGNQTGIAVDSGGNFYLTTNLGRGAVRKYNPAGTELFRRMPSFNVNAVAVDASDNVFVGDNTDVSGIYEFDSSGTHLRSFYGSLRWRVPGIAPSGSTSVFTSEERGAEPTSGVRQIVIPPAGPVVHPSPSSNFASPIGNTKATLNGRINPEGKATTYHFEYITDEDFVAAGNSFGAGTLKTSETALPGTFTFAAAELCREEFVANPTKTDVCELRPAVAAITGLSTETVYHFRAVASNADGSERAGPDATFKTKEPIEFGELWSTGVGIQTATLHAEVNPLGVPATARFQYVELSEFEASGYDNAEEAPAPPAAPIDVGDGETMEEFSAEAAGLAPGTSYRYRFLVTNQCKPSPAPLCEFAEREGVFTTFASPLPLTGCPNDQVRAEGSGTFLPDCRGYEMVSPNDKLGASIETLFTNTTFAAGFEQSSVDGDALTYSAYKAFGDASSAPFVDQYLARRNPGSGWITEGISPKREDPGLLTYGSNQLDRQYQGFSPDLCQAWVQQDAKPILAPGSPEGFPGLYRRSNCGATTGQYEAISTLEPPATEPPNLIPKRFYSELQGTSADGAVAIYAVSDNMTADASPQPTGCVEPVTTEDECERRLYEVRNGQPRFVCILPNGTPNPGPCTAGTAFSELWKGRGATLDNAISDDGSRIFWTGARFKGPLYVRIDHTETVSISASASTVFWMAAANGSKAIYSADDKLFEFDVDDESTTMIAEGFVGLAGGSDDASRLYFASTKVLTGAEENENGDKAVAGKSNLYFYEAGSAIRFVGTLADSDVATLGGPVAQASPGRVSQVVPSGEQLVFMSAAPLTGFDTKDAVTGAPNMEVYRFDATALVGSKALTCPSCNPSGARPLGRKLAQKPLTGLRAAARIPGPESQLYAQRVITDDGTHVYFNSFEALVGGDTNQVEDVYQWRAPGAGGCTTASPSYQAVPAGCIDLISTGKSTSPTELVDASADGSDVFIKTFESLVDQDTGLRDIYDARVNGGFSGLPPNPVICEGDFCQSPATPPVAVAPASRVAGPGNPPQPKPPKKCPKGKHKEKRKGKVVCVKNKSGKKKQAGKKRRADR